VGRGFHNANPPTIVGRPITLGAADAREPRLTEEASAGPMRTTGSTQSAPITLTAELATKWFAGFWDSDWTDWGFMRAPLTRFQQRKCCPVGPPV
jgi:hypothetical protein